MAEQKDSQATVTLTTESLTEMFTKVIQEAKKPDAKTQRLQEEAEARAQENIKQMIAVANAEKLATETRQANCSHTKERGESAWHGQPFSNGTYQAICVKCQKMSKAIPINPSMMSGMA